MCSTPFAWFAGWMVCSMGLATSFSAIQLMNRQAQSPCIFPDFRLKQSNNNRMKATAMERFDLFNNTFLDERMKQKRKANEDSNMVDEAIILGTSNNAVILEDQSEILEDFSVLRANKTEILSYDSTAQAGKIDKMLLSASEVEGELAGPEAIIEAPSVSKILKFAIPSMGVWLCSPLLSMIDTSAVGILSGTINQAALNPAVAVTDYAALCIAFLYTATTNMVASARESERTAAPPGTTSSSITIKTVLGAMQLSTFVGAGLGTILFVFARQLLTVITGTNAVDPAVFASAMKYIRIRSLGMPAAAIIGSAQAACLGLQDVSSPLYVLLAAAIVNFIGDMAFVGCSHPWIGGAAGAAWATVFSQYAAMAFFFRRFCCKPKPKEELDDVTKDTLLKPVKPSRQRPSSQRKTLRVNWLARLWSQKKKPKTTGAKQARQEELYSVKSLLAGRANAMDLVKLPSKEVAKKFVPYVVPVTTTQIGRVSGFLAMSHVVSTALGTISMAAQQILLGILYCLCPISDSLNLSAQTFVPGIWEKKAKTQQWTRALEKTVMRLMTTGLLFGAITCGIVLGFVPLLCRLFTSDAAVMALVNTTMPYLAMFLSVHGIMCASEGLLLGQKDLSFLGRMYGIWCFAVPYFMLRVKRAGLLLSTGGGGGGAAAKSVVTLSSVWRVFIGYQFVRVATWTWRVFSLQRKANQLAVQHSQVPFF